MNRSMKNRTDRKSRRREEIIGRVTSLDAARGRLEIADERNPRRVWIELRGTRMRDLVDSDGDGSKSIRDLFPGDRLKLKVVNGPTGGLRAQSLWRLGRQGPTGGLKPLAAMS